MIKIKTKIINEDEVNQDIYYSIKGKDIGLGEYLTIMYNIKQDILDNYDEFGITSEDLKNILFDEDNEVEEND